MNINTDNNHPLQLQAALIPVCKMVIRFGLHFNEFVRNLQKAYIHAAEEILKQSKIDVNLQAIAIKTGMDRRTISEHKNNINKSYNNPMNKMDMVIVQLQLYSANQKNININIKQLQNIIDSIYAQHIRSKAIIKELLSNKIIIEIYDGVFKLNLTLQQQLVDIRMMADEVDFTAKRLFETYYKNMFKSDEENIKQGIEQDIKLLQKTCLSTKIPLSKHKDVAKQLRTELAESSRKMNKIIMSYESNLPENSYPEIGVTQFQFNSSIRNQ